MKINELKYERTWNLGSYESEKIACQAVVEENEDPSHVLRKIIDFVGSKGQTKLRSRKVQPDDKEESIEKAPEQREPGQEPEVEAEAKQEASEAPEPENFVEKPKRKRGRPPMVKPPTPIQIASTPAPVQPEPEEEIGQEDGTEEQAPEVEPEKREEPAPVKVEKSHTPYNRSIELHKKIVAENLDRHFPNWKSQAGKAKTVSEKLEGSPFLDGEGRVLQSFVDQLVSAMSV